MTELSDEEQAADWDALYGLISGALARFGKENAVARGDYWVVDENNGHAQHKVYFNNLDMLRAPVVDSLQRLMEKFPKWEIFVAVYVEDDWPEMGLIVRKHEIVDGLKREFFPPEYRGIQYEGSRRGTDRD